MDGIIIINKPKGFTSQDVVSKVKKILNIKKAGHTGTLDPLATGVLPVLIGNSTKLSKYLIEHDKTYVATLKLGIKTDTGDIEGEIIEEKEIPKNIDIEYVEKILKSFLGNQKQVPPMYSAIKINGKKLYEYAREGKNIEIPERNIEIYSIKLIKLDKINSEIQYEVKCSKGTYIRVLCEDIAKKIGTVGFMKELNRINVDKFSIENSYSFEDLENENYKIITMEELFSDLPKIELNNRKKELFLNGVMLTHNLPNGIYNIYNNDMYIGTGTINKNLLKRDIILS